MQKKFLITFLFKEGAGPIFTLEMAKGLASNGCQVYAVVSSKISNRLDWENCSALKEVYFLETGSKSNQLRATISFLFHDRNRIAKHFKKIRFDYVISTFYHPWTSTLMKCFKGRKLVICHDPIHHSGVGKMEEVLTTHYIKSADQVLVLTQSFVPLVEKRFGYAKENILYMPHGRMSSYVTHSLNQTSTFDEGKINFLFFGRIEKYKGLGVLAKAYADVCQQYKNISITVAGSGDFKEYQTLFEALSRARIVNRYIGDEEVGTFFEQPDTVLVLPYLDASQSGVIPVALEYQVPIIATETGGLKEQLDNGKLGIFCKPNDVQSLKEAMLYCIENPQQLVHQASLMNKFKESLNWENVVKNIL